MQSNNINSNYSQYLSYNDRKRKLTAEFDNFDANKHSTTIEELYDFLDKKSAKIFNRNIGNQIYEIIKKHDGRITIEDFINQFIETEDTINFRIQFDQTSIEELKQNKDELIKLREYENNYYKNNFNQNQSEIYVNIVEATNLEPISEDIPIESFTIINCGNQKFETAKIYNNRNPIWNETFKL